MRSSMRRLEQRLARTTARRPVAAKPTKKRTAARRATPTAALEDDCVIPPPLPPEALGEYVLSGEAEDERRQIREYVELQAREHVKHVERIKSERIFGREYEVWDVHTNETRWWVMTSPTNLYSQELFPSADHTLSFHVGLTARVAARQETAADSEELERSMVAWRRWQQAHDSLQSGDEAEDFQAVGMRCRECLLEMIRSMAQPAMVTPGKDAPKVADFVGWSELIVGRIVSGSSGEELRRYLTSTAKSVWHYVNWLTHATNAVRFDAKIAVDSTSHVLNAFGAAVIRYERGVPDRCPSCRSYQIDSVSDRDVKGVWRNRSIAVVVGGAKTRTTIQRTEHAATPRELLGATANADKTAVRGFADLSGPLIQARSTH